MFHLLIAFGALQALFLSIILASGRGNLSTRLFAFFLTIEGFTLIERLLAETNLMAQFPHVLGISYPISFLKPPILFLLSLSIIHPGFKLKKAHALHTIPFFLMLLLNVPFYMLSAPEKVNYVSSFITYVPAYDSFNFWFFLSFFLYIGIYLFYSIKALGRYRYHVKNNKLANWYFQVLYLYSGLLFILLIHFALRPSGTVEFPFINEASMLLMTFLIQSIAYSFLSRSKLLEPTNGRFIIDVDQLSKDGKRIRNKLEIDKVYLDDTLNLEEFAYSLGLSKKYVSDVINQSFGISFKDIINKYRVEEVKSLMQMQKGAEVLLIDIGLRSGFNNKVSFYRTFKKYTGKSPSDYYRELSKKVS